MTHKLTDLQLRILEKQTIKCADVKKLLGDYEDNELPATLRARVDSHIRRCSSCSEFEESYRDVITLANQLPVQPITTDVQNRLRQGLNKRLGLNLPMVEPGSR